MAISHGGKEMRDLKFKKPRRDIDIDDYYLNLESKKEKNDGSKCPWCGGDVARKHKYSSFFACTKCGRRI